MLLNSALEDVVFMFRKDGEEELRMGEMKGRIRQVREALERNIDQKDPEFLFLIDELRRILNKGNVNESGVSNIEADINEL
jgi:type I restriction enzyme R subunit